jgi:hypothetical protein
VENVREQIIVPRKAEETSGSRNFTDVRFITCVHQILLGLLNYEDKNCRICRKNGDNFDWKILMEEKTWELWL